MKVIGFVAGATTTVLAAGVLSVSPVQAQQYGRHDPAHDMVTNSATGVVVVRHHHNLDMRKVIVRFRPHHLTIRMRFDNLRSPRHGGGDASLVGFIRTNRLAMPYQDFGDGPWEWEVQFDRRHPYKPNEIGIYDALEPGNVYICFARIGFSQQGMRATVNYRKNVIFVSFPRRCIAPYAGGPRARWVRVSASSSVGRYYDHWIAPNRSTDYTSWEAAFYTPRLYPG
jgi:hypothetical protein